MQHIQWLFQDLLELLMASRRRRITKDEQERFQKEVQEIMQATGKSRAEVMAMLNATKPPDQMGGAHESAKRRKNLEVMGKQDRKRERAA